MRYFNCHFYHFENKKLVKNSNDACWKGIDKTYYSETDIYIDKYIEPEITSIQRKRIVYLINKITPCKFVLVKNKIYIRYKLLNNYYSNLLLLNFIRIMWYKNQSFDNDKFFVDICKRKPRNLDYLEFMMTCIKNNVLNENNWHYGDHSFVYPDIIPKTKEMLLNYKGNSMHAFLQCKIEDLK